VGNRKSTRKKYKAHAQVQCTNKVAEEVRILHSLEESSILPARSLPGSHLVGNYFLAGEDRQQTNQPNDLAGG